MNSTVSERLAGKHAVLTGAAGGIGLAVAGLSCNRARAAPWQTSARSPHPNWRP